MGGRGAIGKLYWDSLGRYERVGRRLRGQRLQSPGSGTSDGRPRFLAGKRDISGRLRTSRIGRSFVVSWTSSWNPSKTAFPASPDLIIALHASVTPEGSCACPGFLPGCLHSDSRGLREGLSPNPEPDPLSSRTRHARHHLFRRAGRNGEDLSGRGLGPSGTALQESPKTGLDSAGGGGGREPRLPARRPGPEDQPLSPALVRLHGSPGSLETVRRLEESRAIEIAPLAYMRGRSLNNCVVILDEAQNTTKEQMKMFLTRLGEHSAAVITGDITQIDLPKKAESGLVHALELLALRRRHFCLPHGRTGCGAQPFGQENYTSI